jgi:hypothetical protein
MNFLDFKMKKNTTSLVVFLSKYRYRPKTGTNLGNAFNTSLKKISFSNLKQFYKRHIDKENEIRNKTVRYCHRTTIDAIKK